MTVPCYKSNCTQVLHPCAHICTHLFLIHKYFIGQLCAFSFRGRTLLFLQFHSPPCITIWQLFSFKWVVAPTFTYIIPPDSAQKKHIRIIKLSISYDSTMILMSFICYVTVAFCKHVCTFDL